MVKIYVEGGGDSEYLHGLCRKGFTTFFEKSGFKGRMPRIVACGPRQQAYDRFKSSITTGQLSILLIDSEDIVTTESPWEHLERRKDDSMPKPCNASDDHCHLMVVSMESWFLSDTDALKAFFGQDFRVYVVNKLNTDLEKINKDKVFEALDKATNKQYKKGEVSFKLLERIDPDKIRQRSPYAERLIKRLDVLLPKT